MASGQYYEYAIYAYNEFGVSEPKVDMIATEEVYQSVTLYWLPVDGAVEYLIERNGEIIAAVPAPELTYTDETALVGNHYHYRIIPSDEYLEPMPEEDLGEVTPIIDGPSEVRQVEYTNPENDPNFYDGNDNVVEDGNGGSTGGTGDTSGTGGTGGSSGTGDTSGTGGTSGSGGTGDTSGSGQEGEAPATPELVDIVYGSGIDPETGLGYLDISWSPIIGAVAYEVLFNGELVATYPDEGQDIFYHKQEGVDPTIDNNLTIRPLAGDGESLGDIDVPIDENFFNFTVNAEVEGNDVTISWDPGSIEADGYKVVIKDSDNNVIEEKEVGQTVFEYTTFVSQAGDYKAVVYPEIDGEHKEGTSDDFIISQTAEENFAPEGRVSSITLVLGEEPKSVDLNDFITDKNGDTLTYEITDTNNTHASVTLDGSELTASANSVGSTIVEVTVDDGNGGVHKSKFYVYVEEPVNNIPETSAIPDQELDITDEPLVLNALDYFTDADGDELAVRVEGVSNSNIGVSSDGTNITITPQKVGSTIVRLVATDEEGAEVSQQFNVIVNEVVPESPQNLSVNALSYQEVNVSFDKVGNADEYIIVRNGEEIARTALTSYTDRDVLPETAYTYQVIAVNEVGQSEPASATVETPAIPVIENLNATVEDQDITVTWDAFDGATRYKIYRYIQLEDGTFQLDNYGQTVSETTFVDKGLKGSTTYKYEVQPLVGDQFVEESASTVTAETEEINLAPVASDIPDQEMDVTAEPFVLDVASYFTDPNGDALTLTVKGVDNTNVEVSADGTTLTITPQTVGDSKVTVVVTDPEGLSVEETFNVKVNEVAPVAPENLVVESLSHKEVQVTFDAVSNAKEYIIIRDGEEIARVTETAYVDNTVQANSSYEYQVIAVNEVGESSPVTGTVSTPSLPTVQNVTATVNGTNVTVTWDAMEGSSRYRVQLYKKAENGDYEKVEFARATADTSYDYEGLEAGEYKFDIIPIVDGLYNEDYAGTTTAEIDASAVETPEHVTIENVNVTLDGVTANVSFDPLVVDGEEITRYRIQAYVKNDDGEYVKYSYAKSTSDVANNEFELESGKDFKFEVTPRVDYVYDTNYSGTAEISVPADAAPTESVPEEELSEELDADEIEIRDVTVTDNGGGTITVEWTAQGESTAYRVYRYVLTEDGTYKLDRFGERVDGTTFIDNNNIKENTAYMYVVVPLTNNHYDTSKAVGGLVTTGEITDSTSEGDGAVNADSVQNVTATQNGTKVELSWDALTVDGQEARKYRVQRYKLDSEGNWVKDGYAPSVYGTSYSDRKAQVGEPYQYHIIPQFSTYDESKAGIVEITLSE